MPDLVTRPTATEVKVRTSTDFELCYMRHQYLRRVKFNPSEEDMKPYMYIVTNLVRHTFTTYSQLFKIIGMYQEDVLNIGRIHLVSFLGLYVLSQNPKKKAEFDDTFERKNFKKPNDADYLQKNRANFSLFFKQRMEDLVRVCRQKSKNIKGQISEEYVVFFGRNRPPKNRKDILTKHRELDYHKLDFSIFKSIRKKAEISSKCDMFYFNNMWYVAIAIENNPLAMDDLINSNYNPYENRHSWKPDDLLIEMEYDNFLKDYEDKSEVKKSLILKKFVSKNKGNKKYIKEVALARKLLKKIGD